MRDANGKVGGLIDVDFLRHEQRKYADLRSVSYKSLWPQFI